MHQKVHTSFAKKCLQLREIPVAWYGQDKHVSYLISYQLVQLDLDTQDTTSYQPDQHI